MNNCGVSKPYLTSSISHTLIISAISSELEILKLKLQYISQNPDFVDDTQQLHHYLDELMCHLNIINRGLPPLPKEMEIFDIDESES